MVLIFDEAKRQATLEARGLDFADTGTIWDGPTFTVRDERRNYPEERFITYGIMGERQVAAVWTWRGTDRRIISLRKANEREQARFGKRMV